jgi:hypothetical protein
LPPSADSYTGGIDFQDRRRDEGDVATQYHRLRAHVRSE